MFRRAAIAASLAAALLGAPPALAQVPTPKEVIAGYADLGKTVFGDTLGEARKLKTAIDAFLADPTDAKLAAARTAWKAARVPYMQTEGFRFGNKVVDDWEGRVNAWPLDEGLIDYVDAGSYNSSPDENPFGRVNVIANKIIKAGGKTIDASKIDRNLLRNKLHQAGEKDANVATGYHAIEFLLWGQDLNGTGPGAGNRPASDYAQGAGCTHGNCDRRATYLRVATDLLVADLQEMVTAWSDKGKAREAVLKKGAKGGLSTILTGLGSLSYGELAGERMRLGLLIHDPEEEHDCFSDNTHNSHYYDALGIVGIYTGEYRRPDGTVLKFPSLAAYAAAKAPRENDRLLADFQATMAAMGKLKETADSGRMAYDQMLAEGNAEGAALIQAGVDGLVKQTRSIEAVVAALGLQIKVEGSDSLDDPAKVAK
jgi:putative iron-regulated protein